jgi:hypothetical protein
VDQTDVAHVQHGIATFSSLLRIPAIMVEGCEEVGRGWRKSPLMPNPLSKIFVFFTVETIAEPNNNVRLIHEI